MNEFTNEELEQIVVDICLNSGFTEAEQVERLAGWVDQTIFNFTVFSLLRKGVAKVSGFEDGQPTISLTEAYLSVNPHMKPYESNSVWGDIDSVLDGKGFDNE